jgi:hypothetical protein
MYAYLSVFVAIPVSREVFFTESGEINNKCANGHLTDLGAKFCPACGESTGLVEAEKPTDQFAAACAQYGWLSPEEGFKALTSDEGAGWKVLEGGESVAVKLVRINVEDDSESRERVYGLGILVAKLGGIGDGSYTSLVLPLPINGFKQQAQAVQALALLLGVKEEAKLYPQVYLS